MINVYSIFLGNVEEKRPLGKARRCLENSIRMDRREIV
jgi:hypothetical protein